ncbi:disks large-associated protein 5-like [Hetaerina americana]|uniref:disks large-associated protein 5-like n=1 Tax=Hetaerina americana TaxID=62018 RepID=UPI003A7F16CB
MYQARRVPFCNKENYNEKRASRAQEKVKNRRFSRQKNFTNNRDITVGFEESIEDKVPQKLSRQEQLLKWKKEKEILKKKEQEIKSKEKPPFKCGLVHHKPPPTLADEWRRSTRIQNKKNTKEELKLADARSKNITGRTRRNNHLSSCSKTYKSFAPSSHQFKAPINLPKIEESNLSILQPVNFIEQDTACSLSFPAQLSPWISKSRGSDGKVSSTHKGKNESPLSDVISQTPVKALELGKGTPYDLRRLVAKRLIEKSLNTPEDLGRREKKHLSSATTPVLSKDDADGLQNFRSLYEGEMNRLDNLCLQWELLSSDTSQEIPVGIKDSIFTTVCQTRLLMREKLEQFKDLLHTFEKKTSKSIPVITCSDLQGFWDLVSIQVNDVDTKFSSLDQLKWNNWVGVKEPKTSPEKVVTRRRGANKKNSKAKKPTAAKSALKAFISEQMKKHGSKENGMINCFGAVNRDTVEEEKLIGDVITPQHKTPTTILKRRSSRNLSLRKEIGQQGDSMTPRRSSRRVTFADTTPENRIIEAKVRSTPHIRVFKGTPVSGVKQNLLLLKSPNFDADKDLISWESPFQDCLSHGRRRSPRFSGNNGN